MKNILIVDDNQMIRDSLSSYLGHQLKNYNYDVLTAEDGKKAIEVLNSVPVSFVLTDLEMPNVDGYGVISYMKKSRPSIPVSIMTGSWSQDLLMLVSKLGVVRCIEKPFHFEEIEQMVIEVLAKDETASAVAA